MKIVVDVTNHFQIVANVICIHIPVIHSFIHTFQHSDIPLYALMPHTRTKQSNNRMTYEFSMCGGLFFNLIALKFIVRSSTFRYFGRNQRQQNHRQWSTNGIFISQTKMNTFSELWQAQKDKCETYLANFQYVHCYVIKWTNNNQCSNWGLVICLVRICRAIMWNFNDC